ncbi:MAG: penicillin-binding protein 1C [Acidobacteria bacterium]|nr:penicillin-binding protein 1C [Acidobacteriota bacterium]
MKTPVAAVRGKVLLACLLLCLLALAPALAAWLRRDAGPGFPAAEEVRARYLPSEGVLLDRNGEELDRVRFSYEGRRAGWTPLALMSPALLEAVVEAEDRRFYAHRGVDWRAALAAAAGSLAGGARRGASTITMQLVSFLLPESVPRAAGRTPGQKLEQMRLARKLEREWTKREILEAYLNLAPFRGELEGITAATLGIFGKAPHGVVAAEAAILAALLRAPNAPAPRVAARAAALGRSLGWKLSAGDLEGRCREAFRQAHQLPPGSRWAPHVARLLFAGRGSVAPETGGVTIRSTLDGSLQRRVGEALGRHLAELAPRNVRDGAVLVVDNASGEVLAYAGSGGDFSSARHVDGVRALRQAGSSLKPFLYALAIDRRLITAASLLEDSPLEIAQAGGGMYRPENYDRRFRGAVTARIALASSINIPAVRVLELTGVESFLGKLDEMEFRRLRRADYYGPSLALGSADIALWDLTNAYRTLAAGGVWTPLRLLPGEAGPGEGRRVFSPEAAFIVGDILADRESRSYAFGLDSPLATPFRAAVKTGTSKDMRDNWCVGYSGRYTVGVWMGNFTGEPMWNVLGVTGAAPLWAEIMHLLCRDDAGPAPEAPPGLVARMTTLPGLGITRREWYLAGTEMEVVEAAAGGSGGRILSPTDGDIIAWDPDIPADRQKLFFEAQPPAADLRWELDGAALGEAGSLVFWTPAAGVHTLRLQSADGETVDRVRFTVRGGPE